MPDLLRPSELATRGWTDPAGGWPGEDIWRVLNCARDGDANGLRALLQRDPTLVHAAYWYCPPLHFAVREGHVAAARLLLEAGADLFHRNIYAQETLLQMALDRGHEAMAALLRAELDRQADSTGALHPVHEAAGQGDAESLARLLAADARLAERGDAFGRRPLHYAVQAGSGAAIDALVDAGADVDALGLSSDDRLGGPGFRPVASALWKHPYWDQRNDYGIARRLLAHGARYSVTIAAALGDEGRVQELLRDDAALANEPELCGKRPLSAAAERGHEGIVRRLLDAGADPRLPEGPNCPGGHALWAASRFGHSRIAELLLDAGADPNAPMESSGTPTSSAKDAAMRDLLCRRGGVVPFYQHVLDDDRDTVAALLDAATVDESGVVEGFTLATMMGHEAMLRLLLERGLRVPDVVTSCQTYLWRSLPLARLLLEHGMAASLPNWQRVTPLHYMAAKGDIECAKLFLEFGADPNAVDEEYRTTPLGWAAREGQLDFVEFGLGRNMEPVLPDVPDWAQPLAWAERRGHAAVADLLRTAVNRAD